jgi:hypothetical protein
MSLILKSMFKLKNTCSIKKIERVLMVKKSKNCKKKKRIF